VVVVDPLAFYDNVVFARYANYVSEILMNANAFVLVLAPFTLPASARALRNAIKAMATRVFRHFYEPPAFSGQAYARSSASVGDALEFRRRYPYELRANWKIALENYLECYHCPVAHPGFSKVIDVDPDAYQLSAGGALLSQIGSVRPSALTGNGKGAYVPRGDVGQAQVLFEAADLGVTVSHGHRQFCLREPHPSPQEAQEVAEGGEFF
jgi:phenylpropionate dioxygenase-like ring-hydroxylating dioxygenase large terminal subunit